MNKDANTSNQETNLDFLGECLGLSGWALFNIDEVAFDK